MKKEFYIKPSLSIHPMSYASPILAGSTDTSQTPAWNPDDTNPQSPTIPVNSEKDNNLGGAGSELTGAKGHNTWSMWDD